MIWVFLGYAGVIYSACALLGTIRFPMHVSDYFLFLPGVAITFGAEMFVHNGREERQLVRRAFALGIIRRPVAFCVGAVAGIVAISICGVAHLTEEFITRSVFVLLFIYGFAVLIPPALGCVWVTAKAQSAPETAPGCPVINLPAAERQPQLAEQSSP